MRPQERGKLSIQNRRRSTLGAFALLDDVPYGTADDNRDLDLNFSANHLDPLHCLIIERRCCRSAAYYLGRLCRKPL
jgi:hypothetical protein